MIRALAPALLCLVAGPAVAQQPVPVQPPPPPLPIQPAQPQPVPNFVFPTQPNRMPGGGGNEPRVVVAKVVDGLVWKSSGPAPVTRQIDVTVLENGQPVTRKQTVTMMQTAARDVSLPLDGLKVKDAAGKKIQPLSLEIRLGEGKGVVLHSGPLPDAIRAMFKDDAVFVETPPGAGQFAQPGFAPDFFPQPAPTFRVRPAPVVEDIPLPQPGRPAPPTEVERIPLPQRGSPTPPAAPPPPPRP